MYEHNRDLFVEDSKNDADKDEWKQLSDGENVHRTAVFIEVASHSLADVTGFSCVASCTS